MEEEYHQVSRGEMLNALQKLSDWELWRIYKELPSSAKLEEVVE